MRAAGDVVEAVRSLAPDGVDVVAEMHGGDDTARVAEFVRPGGPSSRRSAVRTRRR
jgi:NADPH:quinone reductase-like Zn-dependent oxidoreductase